MDFNTQANIAAAKMLGFDGECVTENKDGSLSLWVDEYGVLTWEPDREFNIFNNPADCLAAVKALGEKWVTIGYEPDGWWIQVAMKPNDNRTFDTYEAAVGAACIAVMEDQDA